MISFHLGTTLATLLIFIGLMLLIAKFALRPMLETMKKREDHIENQIKTAETNRVEAEKFLADQREALNEARLEAKEIIERAKAQKEREAEEILNQAQQRAERMIKEATSEIQREKEKAIASLRDEVGALTVQLASKMLEKELDAKGQSKLVDRYLEQVGRLQ
ncbi:F0F1 ATP synthase subunit B [Hazenella coriacea]|uniref:ATP synthase subunit b n=1 Tax=Hazenella coriacea TaxID=1179467 RepID=A0A4R3L7T0_9BACL|nr:F0F1 ATP synthase subunit B [Hazenella coriacea]TCS95592.1 ATP synthase F0 subcomplex B subunit [Hazenella coriacea]